MVKSFVSESCEGSTDVQATARTPQLVDNYHIFERANKLVRCAWTELKMVRSERKLYRRRILHLPSARPEREFDIASPTSSHILKKNSEGRVLNL